MFLPGSNTQTDVFAANITPEFLVQARKRAATFRCTQADKKRFYNEAGEASVKARCLYENHVYYQATDIALLDILQGCQWCTHVLVTNSDNTYNSNCLVRMLEEDKDLVITNFIHRENNLKAARFRRGFLDLGGVLFSKKALQATGGFIKSLPKSAGPQEVHDNDYWFVRNAREKNMTTGIVPLYMFSHN
jgi:hypothetical protein